MVKARKYVLVKRFQGLPKASDLKIVEEELPAVNDGEFLSQAIYLSVDPYMRARASVTTLGTTFIGAQVAKIIESKNPDYPVGKYIVGEFGWRTHTVSDGTSITPGFAKAWIIPDPEGLPLSLSLGVLGMPGNAAYFGFLEICKPQPGETVVVSGAAGAVGSLVGQIAKIKGCKVVGIAGSADKGKWLVDELKFDDFVNYKLPDFEKKLQEVTPKGVDCYFDNVGGETSSIVLRRMNRGGRTSVCGSISTYNDKEPTKASPIFWDVVLKELKLEGFVFFRWMDRWYEGIKQNKEWIKKGKLQYRETVTDGFDKMFQAFLEMLQGQNFGKAIVKV